MTVSTINSKTLNQINHEIGHVTSSIEEIDLNAANPAVSPRQKLANKARRKILVKILKRLKKMAQQLKKGKETAPGALSQATKRIEKYSLKQTRSRSSIKQPFAL